MNTIESMVWWIRSFRVFFFFFLSSYGLMSIIVSKYSQAFIGSRIWFTMTPFNSPFFFVIFLCDFSTVTKFNMSIELWIEWFYALWRKKSTEPTLGAKMETLCYLCTERKYKYAFFSRAIYFYVRKILDYTIFGCAIECECGFFIFGWLALNR